MKQLNKNAEVTGNQTMWIWSMFLIAIAAGGISLGVLIFYGYEYDQRILESQTLNKIIGDCLSKEEIYFTDEADFYSKCRLNKKIMFDDYDSTKLKILICKESCETGQILFQLGSDFSSCDFTGKNENYPRCSRGFFEDLKGNKIEVITGSNHFIRRIS